MWHNGLEKHLNSKATLKSFKFNCIKYCICGKKKKDDVN